MAVASLDWQRPAAALAVAALLAGIWYFQAEFPPANPPPPRYDGAPLVPLAAAVPAIGTFEHFNVNAEDPFIPYKDREIQKAAEEVKARRTISSWRPPARPVEIETPRVDPLSLPRIDVGGGDAPTPVGVLQRVDAAPLVTVRLADGTTQQLSPGQSVGRWTLVGVDGGAVALFRDQRGIVHRFRIGDGDAPAGTVPVHATDSAHAAPAPAPAPGAPLAGLPFRSLADAAKALNVSEAQLRQLMQQWSQGGNLAAPAHALGVDEATLKRALQAFQQQNGGSRPPGGERRGR